MFLTHNGAFEWLKSRFSGQIDHVDYKNRGRHLVIYLKNGDVYYCLFKREFIHSFTYHAKDLLNKFPDLAGHGESINLEWCMWAYKNNAVLIYIYEDGRTYKIYPKVVMNLSMIHEQKQVNTYIEQNSKIERNEKEYWFPCKILEQVKL